MTTAEAITQRVDALPEAAQREVLDFVDFLMHMCGALPVRVAASAMSTPENTEDTVSITRGNLPHWLVADRPYFVTICLHGALPKEVLAQIRDERASLEKSGCRDARRWTSMRLQQFVRLEKILDRPAPER